MSADRPLFPDAASWSSHTTVPGLSFPETGEPEHPVFSECTVRFDTPNLLVRPLLHPAFELIVPKPKVFLAGHLNRPGVNVVFGRWKLGKSRFVQQIALDCLLGRPFLGVFPFQSAPREPVYMYLGEQSEAEVRESVLEQCHSLGLDPNQAMAFLGASPPRAYRLFGDRGEPLADFHRLANTIRTIMPGLLIVDTISDTMGYAPESAADALRNVYSSFRALTQECDTCTVFIDHEGHPQLDTKGNEHATGRPRGSSQKGAEGDMLIGLSGETCAEENRRRYRVKVEGRKAPLQYRYEANYGDGGQRFTFLGYLGNGGRTLADRIAEYRASHPGASATQIARDLAVGKARVLAALAALKEAGLDGAVREPVCGTDCQTAQNEGEE